MRTNKTTEKRKSNANTVKRLLSLICAFVIVATMVLSTGSFYSFAEDSSSSADIAELNGKYVNASIISDREVYKPDDTAEFTVAIKNDTEKAISEEAVKNIILSPSFSDETFEITDDRPDDGVIEANGGELKIVFKVKVPDTIEEFNDMFAVKLSCESMDEEFTNLIADDSKTIYAPLKVLNQDKEEKKPNIRKLGINLLGAGEPTGIKVTKQISGLDASRSFSFTATIRGGLFTTPATDAKYTLNSDKTKATFTLKGGEEIFLAAPEGATITVSEAAGTDYNVVFSSGPEVLKGGSVDSIDAKVGEKVSAVNVLNVTNATPDLKHLPLDLDFDAEATKKIDYLGDNDGTADKDNPDTALDDNGVGGLKDMYRLYLDLKAKSEKAIDVLLVLDQSGSMNNEMGDNSTRQQELTDFLNGTNGNDGFIKKFLSANENNHIAAITFAAGCTDDNIVLPWTDDAEGITMPRPKGGTNYTAGLYMADKMLDKAPGSDNEKIVIFLGDGNATYAYTDGILRNDASTIRFGAGNNNACSFGYFINFLIYDVSHSSDELFFKDTLYYSGALTGNLSEGSFPIYFSAVDAAINIPGVVISEDGKITVTDRDAFDKFAAEFKAIYDKPGEADFIKQHFGDITQLRSFDLYERTEAATDEFRKANPNVALYTIGFSNELEKYVTDVYGNKRYNDEVLNYMASSGKDNNPAYKGQYYYAKDAASLADSINSILFMKNIALYDTLSEYVDAADNKELKVVLTDESGKETVLYTESRGITDDSILESVRYDAPNKKLEVKFNPSYTMSVKDKITASFNVKVNEAAYAKYDELGKKYSDEGDDVTDFAGNGTSSLKDGFFSNKEAILKWTTGENKPDSETYPKPVVQVDPRVCAKIVKTDGKTQKPLADAEFTIFVDDGDGVYDSTKDTEKAVTYTSNVLTAKGKNPQITDANGIAAFYGLVEDKLYWIVETHAPEGYAILKEPKSFKFIGEGNAEVDGKTVTFTDGICELEIKDYPLYELPNAGGSGIIMYIFAGSFIAAFAVMRIRRKQFIK